MRWSSAYKFSAWEHISSPGTIPIPSTRKTEKQTLWLWKIFFLSICLAPNWKTTGHWTSNLSIILEFKNITWQKRKMGAHWVSQLKSLRPHLQDFGEALGLLLFKGETEEKWCYLPWKGVLRINYKSWNPGIHSSHPSSCLCNSLSSIYVLSVIKRKLPQSWTLSVNYDSRYKWHQVKPFPI